MARQHGRLLIRRQVAANEREGDRGLLAGDDHVERLDAKGAALAVCAFRDSNGLAYAIAVTDREYCDHKSTREIAFVLQGSLQRTVGGCERDAGRESTGCVSGGVLEDAVEDIRRHDGGAVRGSQRFECRQHDGAVVVAERRLDDGEAVHRRRIRGSTYERPAPRRSVAREGSCEERDGRVAESSERDGGATGRARLLERRHHPTDDLRLERILGHHGGERLRTHCRISVAEERNEDALTGGNELARADGGSRGAPVSGLG